MYIIGKTGMGKTTLLENMIIQDIKNGYGLAFLDPHGDSAEKVLQFVPPKRINDVIYFNPADIDNPVAFNVLQVYDKRQRHMVASGLVAVFKKIWADSWGPRLEYLLRNAILALIDNQGTTLLGVMRILIDKAYRKRIVANVEDPVVRSFWVDEFSRYTEKFAQEAIAPIQNKIGQFLSNYLIRNIVGQVKSSFNVREIMDENKIIIMNLSKGRIGEDTSQLLGSMMISQIQLAAMTRVDIPEEDRKDFFLYVDEFQNFATDSFANILSEARKYRLDLVMAHQFIEQLSDEVKAAVFGNVGTMLVFRVGAADATALAPDFMPRFTEEDLVNLTKWEIYLKLMIDGVASEAFSARTLPPLFKPEAAEVSEKVVRVSRERYGRDREEVEEKIARWSTGEGAEGGGGDEDDEEDIIMPERRVEMGEVMFKGKLVKAEIADRALPDRNVPWICDRCGKITHLSFEPRKPGVYCKKCLKDVTREKELGIKAPEPAKPVSKAAVELKEVIATPTPPVAAPKVENKPKPQPKQEKVPEDDGDKGGGGTSTSVSLDNLF